MLKEDPNTSEKKHVILLKYAYVWMHYLKTCTILTS